MKPDTEITRVVFRKWRKDPKTVIAIFPDIEAGGGFIQSYEHIGQYGECSRSIIYYTDIATQEEFKDLLDELIKRGYTLAVCKRF